MRPFFILFFFLIMPFTAGAQLDVGGLGGGELTIEQQPTYPGPNETVTFTLNDYQRNVFGSKIEWYVDDSAVPNSENQRQIKLTVGDVGTAYTVKAVLTLPNGITMKVSNVIRPVYLDIIIEPQTHVPDFYLGRALPSIGSQVNLIALVNDGKMLGTDLIYTWRINEEVFEGGPLRGRNKISFTAPQGSETTISLEVSTLAGATLGRRAFYMPSVEPEIHFYEVNELYGTEYRALSVFNLIGNSATVKAEPYYLSSQVYNYPSIIEWSTGGKSQPATWNNPYEVTLQKAGFFGETELGFHIRSTTQFLQGARKSIKVNI